MKKLFFILAAVCLAVMVQAQPKDPVSWKYEAKKQADGSYDLVITSTVEKPWHIYSQNTGKGPIPTAIVFKPNPLVTVVGKIKEEGKLEKVYDPNFKSEVLFYSGSVQFVQRIKLKAKVKTNIAGTVEYMVCNDEQCLPPKKVNFEITVQ